jgi:hypothetical protein
MRGQKTIKLDSNILPTTKFMEMIP